MRRRPKLARPRQRKVVFEPLEPRILLSADLSFAAASGQALDLTLRLQDDAVNPPQLQLVDIKDSNPDTQVVASQALSDTTGVVVTGGDLDDTLIIDFSVPLDLPVSLGVAYCTCVSLFGSSLSMGNFMVKRVPLSRNLQLISP